MEKTTLPQIKNQNSLFHSERISFVKQGIFVITVDEITSSKENFISFKYKQKIITHEYLQLKFSKRNNSFYHLDIEDLLLLKLDYPEIKPHQTRSTNYWADSIIYQLFLLMVNDRFEMRVLRENKIYILRFIFEGTPIKKPDPLHYTRRKY
jgi:hypothetical protein